MTGQVGNSVRNVDTVYRPSGNPALGGTPAPQRPTLRDTISNAWDVVMAPSTVRPPMPQAQVDLNTRAGQDIMIEARRRNNAFFPRPEDLVQRSPDSIANDYGPMQSALVGFGHGVDDSRRGIGLGFDKGKYLAALLRGDTEGAQALAQSIQQQKDDRATNNLLFNRLQVVSPASAFGSYMGDVRSWLGPIGIR